MDPVGVNSLGYTHLNDLCKQYKGEKGMQRSRFAVTVTPPPPVTVTERIAMNANRMMPIHQSGQRTKLSTAPTETNKISVWGMKKKAKNSWWCNRIKSWLSLAMHTQ